MALYDGFFDATEYDEETDKYDREYDSPDDFTNYFAQMIGSGVCIHENQDSFKVRLEGGKAVVSSGYLFIRGYWLRNTADYEVDLPGTGNYAILAHLNLGTRMIEVKTESVSQAYPDSLVLAIVSPTSAEDTRYNTDICGVIDTAGALSQKVEWAINYINTEIESKLAAVEQDIAAQDAKLTKKIAEVQAVADSIVPPPVGTIKFSAAQNVGSDWLRCDGSFVSESQYPELVAALGKLTPSADKFGLVSSGEIAPQITNGVLYGGRLWVYSYSAKKLYGVDVEDNSPIKTINITSSDDKFNSFIMPTVQRPLALSIVPTTKSGTKLFLSQVIADGYYDVNATKTDTLEKLLLIFEGDFSEEKTSINVSRTLNSVKSTTSATYLGANGNNSIPYVVSISNNGQDQFYCAISAATNIGARYLGVHVHWSSGSETATIEYLTREDSYNNARSGQRFAYSSKNKGEAILLLENRVKIFSSPKNLFQRNSAISGAYPSSLTVPNSINIVGAENLLSDISLSSIVSTPITTLSAGSSVPTDLSFPSAARVFVDSSAYLWGKDIYMIFVGTGIIFSRTLGKGSFGYLDTTSVLGTITQFGYLDYSQDEGTLYLLGQDTTNTVKVAKIVLNTLYDYANDGAWLPLIASDGVPAYIKAVPDVESVGD